jgi:hypothetical protein
LAQELYGENSAAAENRQESTELFDRELFGAALSCFLPGIFTGVFRRKTKKNNMATLIADRWSGVKLISAARKERTFHEKSIFV